MVTIVILICYFNFS